MSLEGYSDLPIPPPWRIIVDDEREGKLVFVNDVTGEVSQNHPFLKEIDQITAIRRSLEEKTRVSEFYDDKNNLDRDSGVQLRRGRPSADFTCTWKHIPPVGKAINYSLTIHFYPDESAKVVIHNVEGAKYELTHIDGVFGNVTRLDLFIGATIKLFGRNMTISGTSVHIANEIEAVAKVLQRKNAWIISKLQGLGKYTCIVLVACMTLTSILHVYRCYTEDKTSRAWHTCQ
jgi:hypothetical protein